jgi:hypothetical protein
VHTCCWLQEAHTHPRTHPGGMPVGPSGESQLMMSSMRRRGEASKSPACRLAWVGGWVGGWVIEVQFGHFVGLLAHIGTHVRRHTPHVPTSMLFSRLSFIRFLSCMYLCQQTTRATRTCERGGARVIACDRASALRSSEPYDRSAQPSTPPTHARAHL